MSAEVREWVQVCVNIVALVIAFAALYMTVKQTRISRSQELRDLRIATLVRVMTTAERVHKSYRALFDEFEDINTKVEARTKWLEARELVESDLRVMAGLIDRDQTLDAAWRVVCDDEDSHAVGTNISALPDEPKAKAINRNLGVHDKFREALVLRVNREAGIDSVK